jgi:TP901 family phage tail tape measure protein
VALNTRELLLVLRARDEASRVMRTVAGGMNNLTAAQKRAMDRQMGLGTAIATTGATIAAVGAAGVKWFLDSAGAAQEYQRQAALTRTQIDKVGVSVKQVGDIGKRVGSAIGAPFDQLQSALFDIFSSMDVGMKDAETMLAGFARAAVAGQTDVQTAARATIAIMNAFNVPFKDVNKVLDFQFQLVRKGVGTYEEFARTIGRSIPSAARAGQSYQTLGGMLAYLTRNGLSAAMATASAGRALDAISNSKAVAGLKNFGSVIESSIGGIAFAKLAKSHGMGMMAYMKSLSINVKDAKGNFKPLVTIITDMSKALRSFPAPQKAAILQELFKGAGGTIQARRFFDLVLKSPGELKDFVNMVGSMNKSQGQAGQAFKTMADTYATKLQLMKNNWQILRIEVGEAVIPVLTKVIDVLSKGMKWWNGLDPALKKNIILFTAIASAVMIVVGGLMAIVGAIMVVMAAAAALGIGLVAFGAIILAVVAVLAILAVAGYLIVKNWDTIKTKWAEVVAWVKANLIPVLMSFVNWLQQSFGPIVADVADFFVQKWQEVKEWWAQIWPSISLILQAAWVVIQVISKYGFVVLSALWGAFSAWIVPFVMRMWNLIKGTFDGVTKIIMGVIQVFLALITFRWKAAWEGVKKIGEGIWILIRTAFSTFLGTLVASLKGFIGFFQGLWNGLQAVAAKPINFIIGTVLNDGIIKAWNWLAGKFGGKKVDPLPLIPTAGINPNARATASGGGKNQKFAGGGPIHGVSPNSRADNIPIWATAGEYMVNRKSTRKHWGLLNAINQDNRFALGGLIGKASSWLGGNVPGFSDIKEPLDALKQIANTSFGSLVSGIPKKIVDLVLNKIKGLLGGGGGMSGAKGVLGAMAFGRAQQGKPYIWGSAGPNGYDCSGFWSALVNTIQGKSPYNRIFATSSFAGANGPSGFVRNLASAVRVGVMQGNPGHMAGTINGVNFESRGGDGVVVGPNARGAMNGLFGTHWGLRLGAGLAAGGLVGDGPFDTFNPKGRKFNPLLRMLMSGSSVTGFANGGLITEPIVGMGMSGRTYTFGENGRQETVIPGRNGMNQTINIYTNEINPTRHAQELGWLLSRRP